MNLYSICDRQGNFRQRQAMGSIPESFTPWLGASLISMPDLVCHTVAAMPYIPSWHCRRCLIKELPDLVLILISVHKHHRRAKNYFLLTKLPVMSKNQTSRQLPPWDIDCCHKTKNLIKVVSSPDANIEFKCLENILSIFKYSLRWQSIVLFSLKKCKRIEKS